jgi:hypothetical protein
VGSRPAPYRASGVAQSAQRCGHRLPLARGNGPACRVPRGEQRDGLVGLEPQQGCRVRPDEPGEFLVDHREQLLVADPAGDERRHAPQGRLLGYDLVHIAVDPGRLAGTAGAGGQGLRCWTRHAGSVA